MKPPRFVADCHLGKVAKYLRLLGFDTLYFNHIGDDTLVELARTQDRVILTRDRELSERRDAPCYFLNAIDTVEQMEELIDRFGLSQHAAVLTRCLLCNTPLQPIDKAKVRERIPPTVDRCFDAFDYCPNCDKVYWHGDHYKRMKRFAGLLLKGEGKGV
jgi:uncharacterized protein with PIN domain